MTSLRLRETMAMVMPSPPAPLASAENEPRTVLKVVAVAEGAA